VAIAATDKTRNRITAKPATGDTAPPAVALAAAGPSAPAEPPWWYS